MEVYSFWALVTRKNKKKSTYNETQTRRDNLQMETILRACKVVTLTK